MNFLSPNWYSACPGINFDAQNMMKLIQMTVLCPESGEFGQKIQISRQNLNSFCRNWYSARPVINFDTQHMTQLTPMTVLCPVSGKFGQKIRISRQNSNFPPKF